MPCSTNCGAYLAVEKIIQPDVCKSHIHYVVRSRISHLPRADYALTHEYRELLAEPDNFGRLLELG